MCVKTSNWKLCIKCAPPFADNAQKPNKKLLPFNFSTAQRPNSAEFRLSSYYSVEFVGRCFSSHIRRICIRHNQISEQTFIHISDLNVHTRTIFVFILRYLLFHFLLHLHIISYATHMRTSSHFLWHICVTSHVIYTNSFAELLNGRKKFISFIVIVFDRILANQMPCN